MALTQVDRTLLQRCLQHQTGAWNDFVDRFLGLFYHVIHYTAHLRSTPISPEDVEDIAEEVLLQIVSNDYAALRQFRGNSSLATYLTVIARRICVHELSRRAVQRASQPVANTPAIEQEVDEQAPAQTAGIESLDLVQRLLRKLPSRESEVVRMFYLEGRTYEEISTELNIPVNSIGPILSRARKLLRGENPKKKKKEKDKVKEAPPRNKPQTEAKTEEMPQSN